MTSTITDRVYGESASVALKAPCVAVSNGPLPLVGLTAVGGYAPNVNDRILVKDQVDPTANGIYNASAGAWQRSGDFDGAFDCTQGTLIVVYFPTAGDIFYQLTTFNPSIGTTPLVFAPFDPTILTQALFDGFLGTVNFAGAVNDSYSDAYFKRTAAYVGGVPGHVATCMTIETDVTGTGATNYEWALLAIMNNYANAGNNVAGYFQGNRETATTGPTWAAVCEVRELVPIADPVTGLIGLEINNRSNGTDANGNRVGIDVVCTRYDKAGNPTNITFGVRVQNDQDGANSIIGNAFSAYQCQVAVAFDCANATVTSGSLRMAQSVPILFDVNGTQKLVSQGLGIDHQVGGVLTNRLLSAGGLQVQTVQVVGARNTGWNPWTGILDNASVFNAASVTLVQLAERVAAIQNALTVHGLLGL